MATTFQARVRVLADKIGGPAALSQRSGLSRRTIGAYMSGETDPKRADLVKLAVAGEVSLEWLATGDGDMNSSRASAAERLSYHSEQLRRDLRVEQPRTGYVYVPLYEVGAAAGKPGAAPQTEAIVNELAFREEWIRSALHVSPADLSLVHVEGDSMEPDLRAGDIILIDHTDTTARREGFYVIRLEDALLVKQVQRLPGGVLKLSSRNPTYEPINLPLPAIQADGKYAIIGRVVWACRRL